MGDGRYLLRTSTELSGSRNNGLMSQKPFRFLGKTCLL